MINEFVSGFIEEVKDLLINLEAGLISLEKDPENTEIINNIFRVMHTLKGSSGMVGFKNIQDLTHEFESLYVQIRENNISVDGNIIDLTLKGKDLIAEMLMGNDDPDAARNIISLIRKILVPEELSSIKKNTGIRTASDASAHWYVLIFTPDMAIFERGLDPDNAIKNIKAAGSTYLVSHEKKKSWGIQKEEKKCHTTWEIYLCSGLTVSEVEEIFLFYDKEEFTVYEINPADLNANPKVLIHLKKMIKKNKEPVIHLQECLKQLPALKTDTPDAVKIDEKPEIKAHQEQQKQNEATISVSSHKLDDLMNLVSELVTETASMQAYTAGLNDPRLIQCLENVEKLTKQFRNNALDLRMVPVGALFNKCKRQVRDLSKELNKEVNLIIEGQDIEIDKTILRAIESPLQHIIRNSIDHGIEMEPERIQKGKPAEGLLKITSFYSGASVVIQIQDDGRGINLERVKECAINKGLIKIDQTVTQEELINLIVEPGFTTSENISIVSGRGVGMDVVKKELNRVGGGLEIFTEKDLGTSITMKLPTTLTIIDTLIINVADTQILIPVADIEYCFKDNVDNLFKKDHKYIDYKNNPVPLISLREQFRYSASESNDTMVIVINKYDRKYAITADAIIGEHQAVIKPLGDLFANQPYFSGGSIMVDGKLAFILDTNFLFTKASIN